MTNNPFKVSDRVKCVSVGGNKYLTLGKLYSIEYIAHNCLYIRSDDNKLNIYSEELFVLVEKQQKEEVKNMKTHSFKVGDKVIAQNNYSNLTKGKEYEVLDISQFDNMISIKGDSGAVAWRGASSPEFDVNRMFKLSNKIVYSVGQKVKILQNIVFPNGLMYCMGDIILIIEENESLFNHPFYVGAAEKYEEIEVKVGQKYKQRSNGEIFIVADCNLLEYVLINIDKGYRFCNSQKDINDVFGGYKEHFTLIKQ